MSVRLGLSESHPNHCFAGVFDGHAGQKASEYLSANLVNNIAELKDPTDHEQVRACVMATDAQFLSSSSLEHKEHGSTCIFSVFWPNHDISEKDESKKSWSCLVANVGDSRAMILRADGTCVSLSTDHKPEDPPEEARIGRAGGFVRDNRVDGQLAMSRAMGDWQYKANPALAVADQKVTPICDITTETIRPGDQLFICCDGIVEHMQNEDACRCLTEELGKLSDTKNFDCAELIPPVFELSLTSGSKDNMSAILINFGTEDYPDDVQKSQFMPGPFAPYAHDETFFNAYRDDALKHGVAAEEWLAMAQQVVATRQLPASPFSDIPGLQGMTPQKLQAMLPYLLGTGQIQLVNGEDGEEESP